MKEEKKRERERLEHLSDEEHGVLSSGPSGSQRLVSCWLRAR